MNVPWKYTALTKTFYAKYIHLTYSSKEIASPKHVIVLVSCLIKAIPLLQTEKS